MSFTYGTPVALRNCRSEAQPGQVSRDSSQGRRSSSCGAPLRRSNSSVSASSGPTLANRSSAPLRQRRSSTCVYASTATAVDQDVAASQYAGLSTLDNMCTIDSSMEDASMPAWSRYFHEHFDMGEQLGSGTYGKVRACTSRANGLKYAVKVLPKKRRDCKRADSLAFVEREVQIWEQCQGSEFVCQFEGAYQDDDNVYLVQELCNGGDLEALLLDGPISEYQTAEIMRAVLDVLAECHSKNFVYGDVKPANFLLKDRPERCKQLEDCAHTDLCNACPAGEHIPATSVRMTDFGCAQRDRDGKVLNRRMGTPVYMAPELWSSNYGKEVDVWAAGVMMYQMLCGRYPFWSKSTKDLNTSNMPSYQVMMAVSSNPIRMDGEPWNHISRPAQDLIRKMLDRSICTRITASDALSHPWLQKTLGFTSRGSLSGSEGMANLRTPSKPHLDTIVSGQLLRLDVAGAAPSYAGSLQRNSSCGLEDDLVTAFSRLPEPQKGVRQRSCIHKTSCGGDLADTVRLTSSTEGPRAQIAVSFNETFVRVG